MREKETYHLGGQVIHKKLVDLLSGLFLSEREQQNERVAVARLGVL
jgi:hypothetical protein